MHKILYKFMWLFFLKETRMTLGPMDNFLFLSIISSLHFSWNLLNLSPFVQFLSPPKGISTLLIVFTVIFLPYDHILLICELAMKGSQWIGGWSGGAGCCSNRQGNISKGFSWLPELKWHWWKNAPMDNHRSYKSFQERQRIEAEQEPWSYIN